MKTFSADIGLRGDPPNMGNFSHFFALFKIPTIFLSARIKFRKVCMMLPDVPANITPKNIRIICRIIWQGPAQSDPPAVRPAIFGNFGPR